MRILQRLALNVGIKGFVYSLSLYCHLLPLFGKYSKFSPRWAPMGAAQSVRLRVMSVFLRVKQMEYRKAGTKSSCPFYRGVSLVEVSGKRRSNEVLVDKSIIL